MKSHHPLFTKGGVGGIVTLKVFDPLGKEVTTLVNELKEPGSYEVKFDASRFASGVYFYWLQSGNSQRSRNRF